MPAPAPPPRRRYGTAPTGTPHEKVEPPTAPDFKAVQEITWQVKGGAESGEIDKVGTTGLLVNVPGGTQSWHIPFDAVRGTKNPPPQSQQHVTPEQLSRGAIVQFEANGALQHCKVRPWGKQGARVVTHDGEFDVAYQDIKGLGVHPDVAAEQPEVMAQASAKAAGSATPQEDRAVQPTKYTLDHLQVGLHVTAKHASGTSYAGTIMKVGFQDQGQAPADSNLIEVQLDGATHAGGPGTVLLYPHEIIAVQDPPQEEGSKESGPSGDAAITSKKNGEKNEKKDAGAAVNAQAGDVLNVKIGDHDYGGVIITEAYGEGFKGDYRTPDGALHDGFFGWSEVKGSGAKPKPAAPEAEPTKPPEPNPSTEKPEPSPALKPGDVKVGDKVKFLSAQGMALDW